MCLNIAHPSETPYLSLKHNGAKIDKDQVAQYVNDYFINVGNFNPSSPQEPNAVDESVNPEEPCNSCIDSLSRILEKDVFKIVNDINISKSSGLENVSSFIVKEAFKILIPEVTYMYNLSISSSKFPKAWKQALVIPIPKVGNLSLVQNYRPISLLPLPGKILEKIIHQQLSDYFEQEALLTEDQHGFRKAHSTNHSVAQLTNYVCKKLDSRMPTLVAYVDFRKAFDCVQHPILLIKLVQLGVGEKVLMWIESYLSERVQKVLANDVRSTSQSIVSGMPQGSVLGPLFYIIYANDVSKIVKKCGVALYADDTVLYTANDNFVNSISKLQEDMNSLNDWCTRNGIKANTDKTKVMVLGTPKMLEKLPKFDIDNVPLQVVSMYKYLGITLDS